MTGEYGNTDIEMKAQAIGVIHSPYKSRGAAPPQGRMEVCEIEFFGGYDKALQDIETFSHLNIFYWLHKGSGYHPIVQTPWDTKPHGLFATRSPNRPTPIGFAVVKLKERRGNILIVEGLDAIDGTPVVDIKPYIPGVDAKPDANGGWLEGKIRV